MTNRAPIAGSLKTSLRLQSDTTVSSDTDIQLPLSNAQVLKQLLDQLTEQSFNHSNTEVLFRQ